MVSRSTKSSPAKHRSFVLVTSSGKHIGRYLSASPASAAKKAGNRILKKKNQMSTRVHLQETTQGSLKKSYKYIVRRVKLTKQKIVKLKGKRVVYKFKTTVKSTTK
jgi:hypothetical protein